MPADAIEGVAQYEISAAQIAAMGLTFEDVLMLVLYTGPMCHPGPCLLRHYSIIIIVQHVWFGDCACAP